MRFEKKVLSEPNIVTASLRLTLCHPVMKTAPAVELSYSQEAESVWSEAAASLASSLLLPSIFSTAHVKWPLPTYDATSLTKL